MIINNIICDVLNISSPMLINVKSDYLCNELEQVFTFKSESQFKELVSWITKKLDDGQVQQVVEEYFQYMTLLHVWRGKESLF